jgi:predicted transcriptional regulator YdeE
MKTAPIEQFYIIGKAIRTTNEHGKSATDIPQLWEKFFSESSIAEIPNKIDHTVYCVYTDYEKDHTRPYTTILGCRVNSLNEIPEGFTGKIIEGGNYTQMQAKGKTSQGIVFLEWVKIWSSDMPRTYTTDFEVYGEKARDPDNAEVDIFVAVK